MIDRLSPLARNLALVALCLLVGWFFWVVRSVLNPLILAYLLAFILHPLVLKLEGRGWSRRKAVNLIFCAFAIVLTLVGLGIFFQAQSLVTSFASDEGLGKKIEARVDEALAEHQDEIKWLVSLLPRHAQPEPPRDGARDGNAAQDGPTQTGEHPSDAMTQAATTGEVRSEDLWRLVREAWQNWLNDDQRGKVTEVGTQATLVIWSVIRRVFGGAVDLLGILVLWPIYTYFLLFELERIHSFVKRYLPYQERDRIVRIGTQIGEVLASFFRGRLLVCLAKGTILAIGLAIAGVDYALLLGLATGFLSLIPFVGSAVGFALALVIGMLEFGLLGALWRCGLVFLVAETVENYVLIPKILGNSLGLHPIVVIFAIMAGGASMGMFGLLLALPITASLVILAREFLLPVLAQMASKDASRPPPAPPAI